MVELSRLVLVFDLDDTLYPERQFALSGFAAAGAWLEDARGVGGLAASAEKLFFAGQRRNIFDLALGTLQLPADPTLVGSLVEVYRSHKPKLSLFPDADELLQLCGAKISLGLLTDGWLATQRNKVQALGLEQRLSCLVFSDEAGVAGWKPSHEPYRKVMTHFGGDVQDYAYIGDNPAKDFIAARALGWHTIRIRRPHGEHCAEEARPGYEADREIADLRELRHLVQSS